ncbi:MAG TPA: uroporphyrinogen-III C-methyltransferase [Dehalococcoidia bacterium]
MSTGKVWLIGAGPGDPGLITVAGLAALAAADVVVYDRLVNPRLLEHARPDAERVYVGKAPGAHALSQEEINNVLVARAREGRRVARLKGGDPFVFGRGGEEAERLAAAGIPFVVVPGVTSAVAVPAYAGIPVTHREAASSFAVVTGHEDPAKDGSSIRWEHLATAVDTLVFLMGVSTLPSIVEQLVRHGRDPRTPVACIRWGTTPQQETVTGTLADIAARVEAAGLEPPVVTVVGDVVRLRDHLRWFDARPLFGRRVLVTRTRRQASALSDLLRAEGAEPIELPAIEIRETGVREAVDAAVDRLSAGTYAWVVFTSANGVEAFFGHLRRRGRDARAFRDARLCVIGPGTAAALERHGLTPDLVPGEYIAEAVVAALTAEGVAGLSVLVPRAEGARPELVEGLAAAGARVEEVPLYAAAPPAAVDPEVLALVRRGGVDAVTFASSSTVRNLHRLLGGDWSGLERAVVACIGPVTAETARELGLRPDVVAPEHSIPGLVAALKERFTQAG